MSFKCRQPQIGWHWPAPSLLSNMESFKLVREDIEKKSGQSDDPRLRKWLDSTNKILADLDDREIKPKSFNDLLKRLKLVLSGPTKYQQIRTFYSDLTRKLAKEYDLVTPKYYQTQWMMLGMTLFGLPMGLAMGAALDNMAFMGIGLPVGMPIGLAIGMEKDKKALAEGRVLDI